MQTREDALRCWLKNVFSHDDFKLTPLSGDASFRRYFRLFTNNESYVVMDAPPEKEPLAPFLAVQTLLKNAEICVPECFAKESQQGFLLLSDFGDQLLLYSLTPENTETSYEKSIQAMIQFQSISPADLPQFNQAHIHQELGLFQDWFLQKHLGLVLTEDELHLLQETFDFLAQKLVQQPQVFIHRDYHSRNIMRLTDNRLGLIDFQDAMRGPLTYDLVSLLKDCYIQWPQDKLEQWTNYYYTHAPQAQQLSYADFMQAFEFCGLQRHLKVLGIFSRLALRDNKTQFLNDLPLTLHYVLNCLQTQPKLERFYEFMQQRIGSLPAENPTNASCKRDVGVVGS
jgi:aminoglycoside/choline kinase family phosphotransferase